MAKDRPREWTPRREPKKGVFQAGPFEIRVAHVGPNPVKGEFYDDYDIVIRDQAGTEFRVRVSEDKSFGEVGSGLIHAAYGGIVELDMAANQPDMFRDNWFRQSFSYPTNQAMDMRLEAHRLLQKAKKFKREEIEAAEFSMNEQLGALPEKFIPGSRKEMKRKAKEMLDRAMKERRRKLGLEPPEAPTLSGGSGPREWSPRRPESVQDLEGWLRGVVIVDGEGQVDLGRPGPVYVALVHDGSGFNPAAAIVVDQNPYHDLSNDVISTAYEIMEERAMKNEAYVKELQDEWGERWDEILTEGFDGKVWVFQNPAHAAAAIKTDDRAKKFIDINPLEPE